MPKKIKNLWLLIFCPFFPHFQVCYGEETAIGHYPPQRPDALTILDLGDMLSKHPLQLTIPTH